MRKNHRCSKCGKTKHLKEFRRRSDSKTGHGKICALCYRAWHKQHYTENRATETVRLSISKRRRKEIRPLIMNFESARKRAKIKGVPFTIRYEDLPHPNLCPVFKIPLSYRATARCDASASIDEIIPGLGYVPGNVAVISFRANAIKNNASVKDLMAIARYIRRFVK